MDDDFVIIPDLGRRATIKTIVVPPPAPAPVPQVQAPAPAPVIHTTIYEAPIPFTGPPPAVYVSPTAASQGPQTMIQSLGDPTISSTINYSPHLETNYSQNKSYYLKEGQGGTASDNWYTFPTQNGQIIFDVSGGSSQTILEGTAADLTYAGSSLLPANWYQYPTQTGEVEFIDASGSHLLKSIQGDLFFDGELLAKANDIQDIADWSLYPALANISGNGFSIDGVLDVSASGVLSGASLSVSGDISGATLHVSGAAAVGSLSSAGDISGATLHISGAAAVGSLSSVGDISGATLHISGTATIHDIDLSGCALTSNAAGTALFVNGVEVQTGTPSDASQWATFPAVANVAVNDKSLLMTGSLVPPATNKFGLGTALAPIGINDQYAFNTNIYNISPVGTMNISSNSSMALLCTSASGTNEFNITLAGAAGEDMNLTAPDINLTMTDPTSFMNFTAPFGVNIAGGGLFMESGAIECLVGLDIRLITPGNIAIGSGNVGGATTQIEKFEYTDNVVEPMNGVFNLKLKNIEVINEPRDAGSAGFFSGAFNVQSSISNTFTVNSVATSSQKTRWSVQADQGSSRYAAMNLEAVTGGVINYNMIAGGITMNMMFDATTLNINRPVAVSGNVGATTMTTGSLTATGDVSGASGHFGPLFTNDTNIHLGSTAGSVGQQANSIAIGNAAGVTDQSDNAVAIGPNAGQITQGNRGVAIGLFSGNTNQGARATAVGVGSGFSNQGTGSVAIGRAAGNSFLGTDSVAIGNSASIVGGSFANTVVINATGAALNPAQAGSTYIAPLRETTDTDAAQTSMMRWNSTTKEVSYAPFMYDLQVIATSATAIDLTPRINGKTFILTGTTTQAFTTTSLTILDFGFFVIVHNGNAVNGGDINLTGMTGTNIIHEQKSTQNGGNVYLFWNGTGLVGY